jgi:hypothetical protein
MAIKIKTSFQGEFQSAYGLLPFPLEGKKFNL